MPDQTKRIPVAYFLHDLAPGNAADGDSRDRHLLAGRRYIYKFPLVGALSSPAGDYLITFGQLVFNGKLGVGKSSAIIGHQLFIFLWSPDAWLGWIVEDEVSAVELIDDVQPPLTPDLLLAAANDGLVFFGHGISPFVGSCTGLNNYNLRSTYVRHRTYSCRNSPCPISGRLCLTSNISSARIAGRGKRRASSISQYI